MLAICATLLMPALIAVLGLDNGYPPSVIGPALLIWGIGTGGWLGYNWRWLKPGNVSPR
jgi:hypothetical protein